MRPSHHHRFLSVGTGINLDLEWPPRKLPLRERFKRMIFGAQPDGPALVDPDEFRMAVSLIHDQPEEAANGFAALGYHVTSYRTEENNAF